MKQGEVANEIIDNDLSVRETEKLVKQNQKEKFRESNGFEGQNDKDPNIMSLEKELTALLGLRVEIS